MNDLGHLCKYVYVQCMYMQDGGGKHFEIVH